MHKFVIRETDGRTDGRISDGKVYELQSEQLKESRHLMATCTHRFAYFIRSNVVRLATPL